jgi:hypothetical protein
MSRHASFVLILAAAVVVSAQQQVKLIFLNTSTVTCDLRDLRDLLVKSNWGIQQRPNCNNVGKNVGKGKVWGNGRIIEAAVVAILKINDWQKFAKDCKFCTQNFAEAYDFATFCTRKFANRLDDFCTRNLANGLANFCTPNFARVISQKDSPIFAREI